MTDERTVQEGTGGHQRDDTDVLVHFFGTYDLWVPVLYLLPPKSSHILCVGIWLKCWFSSDE